METTTKDGWLISTVDQDGIYRGEEMGRVWLKSPAPRTNSWHWFDCGSVKEAQAAAEKAAHMTYEEFEEWWRDL